MYIKKNTNALVYKCTKNPINPNKQHLKVLCMTIYIVNHFLQLFHLCSLQMLANVTTPTILFILTMHLFEYLSFVINS